MRRATTSAARILANETNSIGAPSYEGWSQEEHLRVRRKHVSPVMTPLYKNPPLFHYGNMQYLYDSNNQRYLDLFGGVCTVSVGHNHPYVSDAVKRQMDKVWHTTHLYMTPPLQEYAQKLTAKLPDHLSVCFFTNSGSEANDMALMLARMHTGNHDVISLRNGYHGMMNSIIGAVGMNTWRHKMVVTNNMHQCMNPDPFKGPWGGLFCRDSPVQTGRKCDCDPHGQCRASDAYYQQFKDIVDCELPKNGVAGVLIEGIQGGGGIVQFPKGFVKQSTELVQSNGGVYIADEVQTGFGRLGDYFWGFEMHNAKPDIVTMAKSIGNGFPLAAVVTTPEIAKSLSTAIFFNTFGGNPLSCTAGNAVLDVIENEGLQENAGDVGTYLISGLAELKTEYPNIGDVRGKGLMIGIEMVQEGTTKPLDNDTMSAIHEETLREGILIGRGGRDKQVFRIQPPMCITRKNADVAIDAFRSALGRVLKRKHC